MLGVFPNHYTFGFLCKGCSVYLELTDSVSLAGQQIPGNPLSLVSQHWNSRHLCAATFDSVNMSWELTLRPLNFCV